MKNFGILFSITAIALLFSSCAKIFFAPDVQQLASEHRTVAIMPPAISIAAGRGIDAEALEEQQRTESLAFQGEIYSWMLRRKAQGDIRQEFQDVQTTNTKLQAAGYPDTPLTTAQLCEILGVDGVITSNFALSRPMSDAAAAALLVTVGVIGVTNEVRGIMSIHDCSTGNLIWNYQHKMAGAVGSTPASVVNSFLKRASRKKPYSVK
jgi:hypothetical protein